MAVSAAMNASRRRFVYGTNVALSIVLAVALVVLVVYLGNRFKTQKDLTSAGVNSLSQRTVQLLRGLPQDLTITGVYTVLSEYQQFAQKRQDAVRDLLNLYESARSGRITTGMIDPMKEPAKVTGLLKRLRDKPAYKDESKPHEEALAKFPGVNDQIARLVSEEVKLLEDAEKASPELARARPFAIIKRNFSAATSSAQDISAEVNELVGGDVPRFGRAIDEVRKYLRQVRGMLADTQGWLTGDALSLTGLTGEVKHTFETTGGRYQPVLTEIDALTQALENLKRVKLEETYDKLSRWPNSPPVLVETADEARVLTMEEVWPMRTGEDAPAPDDDPREFAGEQAISSAILQLTQKEKTAVVFTRFGGESPIRAPMDRMAMMMGQMPRAPFQALNQALEEANFVTEDWNVAEQKAPPEIEEAARRIYVVFPPEPPPQPNPMQPSPKGGITPADVQIITDAVNQSGMAIFLAGWAPPTSPLTMAPGTYEFADYLKTNWGIDVQYRYLGLQFTVSPQKPDFKVPANPRDPLIVATPPVRLTDHPIAKPVQTLPGAFHTICPLRVLTGDEKPKGVTTETVAEVEPTEDVWAFDNLRRVQEDLRKNFGTRPAESDIRPPFPLAVAATNEAGQKLLVFASENFAADAVAGALSLQLTSKGLQAYASYPANTDLFLNSLYWLTGDADRIAVGPRSAEVPRLDRLKEGPTAQFCRIFLVGIWPAVALLVGGGVWMFRRR